jgi:hypothetical protein
MKFVTGLAALLIATPLAAAQIQIAPATIFLNPVGRYSDLVVQAIGVRADNAALTVDSLTIDLLAAGQLVERRSIPAKDLVRDSAGLADAPPPFVAAQLLNQGGLAGFFGKPTTPGTGVRLRPDEALATVRQYFATATPVDTVRVTLAGVRADGRAFTEVAAVPVQQRKSPISYRAPVRGSWLMQALPSLQSHHRFNSPSEFAVDFMKVDGEGRVYNGDILKAQSYYAFGAPVLAAADGVVVRVVDGAIQDRAATTRRPDETPQAAGQRIGAHNMARMQTDFVRALAGNLVIIKHEKDGILEYSSYGHLKAGIPVREGASVKQGDVIGAVGDTGDSPTVHLHFQVNAGPDPFSSASLPVTFADLRPVQGNTEPGRFIEAK